MKAKIFLVTLASALMLCTAQVSADTVVTAPIDSRPISCEYLADLAALSGDTVVYPDKDCMDFFASDESLNRFADSAKVRQSIYKLTGENNKESSTVIINTSTYFTGGLVGSRIGSCYGDIDTAMEDLCTLSRIIPCRTIMSTLPHHALCLKHALTAYGVMPIRYTASAVITLAITRGARTAPI